MHPSRLPEFSLLEKCLIRRTRHSGPGGQHRNKVETAVVLKHEPTGVEAEANERRSQAENRRVALFRLRLKLAVTVRSNRLAESVPSELWQSRCRGGRIAINSEHVDFPTLLAEALDCLLAVEFDLPSAAERLSCTASQILKLLKVESPAWELFHRERAARGLHRLR